jgi:hypothetical protein
VNPVLKKAEPKAFKAFSNEEYHHLPLWKSNAIRIVLAGEEDFGGLQDS